MPLVVESLLTVINPIHTIVALEFGFHTCL